MPTITKRVSSANFAANTIVENILAGSQYEFAPFDGTIEVGIAASAPNVVCAVFSGPDVLAEPGTVVPNAGSDRTPIYPDDFFLEDDVAQGDRLKITLTNLSGAAANVTVSLRITPA